MNLADISKLSPAHQKAVMADQARATAARERIMASARKILRAGYVDEAARSLLTPLAKSPKNPVSASLAATPANLSHEEINSVAANSPRSVRGAVKRITVARTSVDAGVLHPITEQVPGKTLERHAPVESGGSHSPKSRPKVHFTLYRVALLDPDNKWASVKFLLDAMRYAGLIPNDRECDIEMIVTQQKVAHRKEEGTGVEILYP